MRRALVLAGGGLAGIAWELGLLLGVRDADPGLAARLLNADMLVGTSAGSAVAAQITTGTPLEELYAAQLQGTTTEIGVTVDLAQLLARFTAAMAGATSEEERRQRIGALALATPTVQEPARRAAIAARLPVHTWPARTMLITAIDAESGRLTIFTAESGVCLIDAVAASCAVPGVWPPVTIEGRRYIDGGVRSATNADLASGCDTVVVLTPAPADTPEPWGHLEAEITALSPAAVRVVSADPPSLAAFGTNPLAPATRAPSAQAGRAQGRSAAADLAAIWT